MTVRIKAHAGDGSIWVAIANISLYRDILMNQEIGSVSGCRYFDFGVDVGDDYVHWGRESRPAELVHCAGEKSELAPWWISPDHTIGTGRRTPDRMVIGVESHILDRNTRVSHIRRNFDKVRFIKDTGIS